MMAVRKYNMVIFMAAALMMFFAGAVHAPEIRPFGCSIKRHTK
jgi:hypothetical protein